MFIFLCRIGTIDLARNNLTKVDFQMFADLQFVDTIDLAENAITEIGREAFKNLYQVQIYLCPLIIFNNFMKFKCYSN